MGLRIAFLRANDGLASCYQKLSVYFSNSDDSCKQATVRQIKPSDTIAVICSAVGLKNNKISPKSATEMQSPQLPFR